VWSKWNCRNKTLSTRFSESSPRKFSCECLWTFLEQIKRWGQCVNAWGLRQVDEKISRLTRGMHLSVVYPVYRASGAYRLNNTGSTHREWCKGCKGCKDSEGLARFDGPRICDALDCGSTGSWYADAIRR